MTAPPPWPLPRWVAHRGAGKLAPENTLAAVRLGASWGFRAFECDAKLSADGVVFLLHDATLERTTSGRGVAGEQPWSELARLDAGSWHGRAWAGEPLATLEAVVRFAQANAMALDVEIKPTPGTERATGAAVAAELARLTAAQPMPLLLSSFRPDALQAARETAPQLPRSLLLDSPWDGWLEAAQALACVGVIPHYALLDAALAARLRAAGLRTAVYTVNDPAEVARQQALGTDSLITDAVDRFAPVP